MDMSTFLNRKRWSAVDVKKAEKLIQAWQPHRMTLEEYVRSIMSVFPTRSYDAVLEKSRELAASKATVEDSLTRRFEHEWSDQEKGDFKLLFETWNQESQSAASFARQIKEFFPNRTESALVNRLRQWRLKAVEEAANDATTPPHPPSDTDVPPPPKPPVAGSPPRPVTVQTELKLPPMGASELNVGECYDARIMSLAEFGVFVELTNTRLRYSGLVHKSEIWSQEDPAYAGNSVLMELPLRPGDSVSVKYLGQTPKGFRFSLRQAGFVPPVPSTPSPVTAEVVHDDAPPQQPVSAPAVSRALSLFRDLAQVMDEIVQENQSPDKLALAHEAIREALGLLEQMEPKKALIVLRTYLHYTEGESPR